MIILVKDGIKSVVKDNKKELFWRKLIDNGKLDRCSYIKVKNND